MFALPNFAHVEHAEPLREEVASALGSHFGGRLELRLVTDPDSASEAAAAVAAAPVESVEREGGSGDRPRRQRGGGSASASGASRQADTLGAADFDSEVGEAAGSHDPLEWAQSRLLQESPGAEEVSDGS